MESRYNKLSPDARDWLTLALDPFHDWARPVAGYPDSDSSRTIVSCYQYAVDVSKPAAAAGNWDCHVMALPTCPVLGGALQQHVSTSGNYVFQQVAASANFPCNPVQIISVDAGQPTVPTSAGVWAPTNLNTQAPVMGSDVGLGASRVIGFGIEVVNTTADIYKQGTLTAYRMPQDPSPGESLFTNSASTQGSMMYHDDYRYPPSTVADCTLLRGTEQWAAADGVYMAVPFSTINNPITIATPRATMFTSTGITATGRYACADGYSPLTAINNMPVLTASGAWNQKRIPICTSGVILTGLSNQTTLRVKVKVYVEAASTFSDSKLSVLSTISAPYDAKALELYSSAVNILPVAVKFNANAAGDWWRMVLDAISSVAPTLGVLTGFPLAGMAVGAGTWAAGQVLKNASRAQNQVPAKEQQSQALVVRSDNRQRAAKIIQGAFRKRGSRIIGRAT